MQFKGPVLELMTDSRTRLDQRIAGLGPDILAAEFDSDRFLRRLREDDPTRPIGDAVLDQRTVAGIGNLWKAEACFAAGIDPWRRTGDVTDAEALAIVEAARPRMLLTKMVCIHLRPAWLRRTFRRYESECRRRRGCSG